MITERIKIVVDNSIVIFLSDVEITNDGTISYTYETYGVTGHDIPTDSENKINKAIDAYFYELIKEINSKEH